MKTETPRTDAVTCGKGYGIPGNTVSADFCRQLERDLNQLLAAAKHLAECDCQSNYIKVPCVQCDAAHAIIKQCDVAAMPNNDIQI